MLFNIMILSTIKYVKMSSLLGIFVINPFLLTNIISSMITTTMIVILLALMLMMSLRTTKEWKMHLFQMYPTLMLMINTFIMIQ